MSSEQKTGLHYIIVYDEDESVIGYINAEGKLTENRKDRAGFSSKQTAEDACWQFEIQHKNWYPEVVDD